MTGYYEDSPNSVTLAMSGWGDAEPASWRILQAQPDAPALVDVAMSAVSNPDPRSV